MISRILFLLVFAVSFVSIRGQNESVHESPLQTMYITITKPGLGLEQITENIFKQNSLTGSFNSCIIAQAVTPDDANSFNASSCYQDDIYNDRISFKMTYRSDGDIIKSTFEKHPPSVQVIDENNAASPQIAEVEVHPPLSTAEVTVAYHCAADSNSLIRLMLLLQFGETEQDSLRLQWVKNCKGGVHDNIEFGYLVTDRSQDRPIQHLFADDNGTPLVVHPSDVSTEVFAKLGQMGAQQEFLAPFVTSSRPDIATISVRGNHPSGGILTGLNVNSFQINYECVTKGSSEISATLAIPPFNNLTANWEKECGGKVASNLMVGTTKGGSEVVDGGKPTPRFMVGVDNIGTEHDEAHLHLPGNQSTWTVYLQYRADSDDETEEHAALHIGRISLTVEHDDVIVAQAPAVSKPGMLSWKSIANSGQILRQREMLQLSLHFICRQIGESRILITIPVLEYDTLEFGIAKECTHIGTARKSHQLVLTTSNIFWMFVFISISAVVVACIRIRHNKKAGFVQVATQEV